MDSITFTPKPGFVVKSSTLGSGFYHHNPSEFIQQTTDSTVKDATSPSKINVPSNHKVFINLAYTPEVPPPPIDDETAVQRALLGQIQDKPVYFIPMLVGFGREDKDKAGNPSTVFDAFFNPLIKKRLTEDINYRSYVLELILSTLESPPQFTAPPDRSLSLSRTLATPNIRFKGPLLSRRVQKAELDVLKGGSETLSSNPPTLAPQPSQLKKPLIEEIASTPNTSLPTSTKQPPKSILKKTTLPAPNKDAETDQHVRTSSDTKLMVPTWRWTLEKPDDDVLVKISIDVPDMTRSTHSQSTLSLSTDIMTIRTPQYFLQIPISNQTVKIPPNRVVDIDKAKAEWRVGEKVLIVYLRCVLKS